MENKNMPAFPVQITYRDDGTISGAQTGNCDGFAIGLTKRELIAAMAMQGMLSNPKLDIETTPAETIAQDAIVQADILLLELSKPRP